MDQEEYDLIVQAQNEDHRACGLLLQKYVPVVFRFFHQTYNFPTSEAMDLMQEAFFEIWKALPTFEHRSSFTTWCLTICRRKAMRRYELKTLEQSLDSLDQEVSLTHSPEAQIMARGELGMLMQLVQTLPHELREPLYMHYFHEMSQSEVAEFLKLPQGTVKDRLRRAKEMLFQKWSRLHGE